MSVDPLGLGPDGNPFRYVGNEPTNVTDPSGLMGGGSKPTPPSRKDRSKSLEIKDESTGLDGVLTAYDGATFNWENGVYITYQGKNADKVQFFQVLKPDMVYYSGQEWKWEGWQPVLNSGTQAVHLVGTYTAGGVLHRYRPDAGWQLDYLADQFAYYSDQKMTAGHDARESWMFDSPVLTPVLKERKPDFSSAGAWGAVMTTDFITYVEVQGKVVAQVEWFAVDVWEWGAIWDTYSTAHGVVRITRTLHPDANKHRAAAVEMHNIIQEWKAKQAIDQMLRDRPGGR
jgi:hypothetical protein